MRGLKVIGRRSERVRRYGLPQSRAALRWWGRIWLIVAQITYQASRARASES